MASFTAKWRTKCGNPACTRSGGWIEPGELMTWSRRGVKIAAHVDCYLAAKDHAALGGGYQHNDVPAYRHESPAEETPIQQAQPAMQATPDGLASVLAESLKPYLKDTVEARLNGAEIERIVTPIVKKHIAELVFPTQVIVKADGEEQARFDGIAHRAFAALLQKCQARDKDGNRLNVWLHGPAGTGKTTAARFVADCLKLAFRYTGAIDTQYALTGFVDAQGRIVSTEFRKAYSEGGVFLFDEVDGSSPNATLAFNAALANGHACFPDGNIERHKDCLIIAAANTWGLGATNEYVGRNKLDAAFLDRFVYQDWPIDEALELATSGNAPWCYRVQSVRRAVRDKGIKVLITPRATYAGAALLAAGVEPHEVEQSCLRKGMSDEQWRMVASC